MRCYFAFSELSAIPAFPVSERTVLLRSAICNDGRTFGHYANFVRNACFFLNVSTAWFSSAVINTVNGLRSAGKGKFRFHKFIRSDLVIKVINFEPIGSQFAQLAFCAHLFALRVPSEALHLRRASSSDSMDMLSPAQDEALIAVRQGPQGPKLIPRLAYRKNLPTGCVLYRPCFCGFSEASPKHHGLCPIHVWRMHVCCRVEPGRLLIAEVNPRNISRVIKTVFRKLKLPRAESYTAHGFRRGASRELKERGSQWATAAGAGGWRSLASRGYVDTAEDISRAMDKLLIEDFDANGSDGEESTYFLWGENPPGLPARCTMGVGVFRVMGLRGF